MMNNKNTVYVVGHKNPDTDSICSAIAYAHLQNEILGEKLYIPMRAGSLNEETGFVLNQLNLDAPDLLPHVCTQVSDLDINKMTGIDKETTLKEAWDLMQEMKMRSLPIVHQGTLGGMISISDIANAYMTVSDSDALSKAKTSFANIAKTIGAQIYTSGVDTFVKGNVIVSLDKEIQSNEMISEGDLVILGIDSIDIRIMIEKKVSCIILIGTKNNLAQELIDLAIEKGVVLMGTTYKAMEVMRLMNQSIAVEYVMTKENLVSFNVHDCVNEITDVMAKKRHRDFPVTDNQGNFVGLISRRRLLSGQKKQVVLVDHNEKNQAVDGLDESELLGVIDHHKISLDTVAPLFVRNQPVGCTCTIITQMYRESNIEIPEKIAFLLCSAILSDTLMFRSPTCTPLDKRTAEELAKIANIEIESYANDMFRAGSNFSSKTPKEICYQDFKNFEANGVHFGVGQVSFMGADSIADIRDTIEGYMPTVASDQGVSMVFFMLTDILAESTTLLCYGEGSVEQIKKAFQLGSDVDDIYLEGIVSRKKQFIPAMVTSLQA